MKHALTRISPLARRMMIHLLVLWMATSCFLAGPARAFSQDAAPIGVPPPEELAVDPLEMYEAAMATEEPQPEKRGEGVAPGGASERISLLDLLMRGGLLMLPIGALSLMAIAFGLERTLALRRRKILPPELIDGLGKLAAEKGGFDPRKAYELCQQHPSTAANVIRTVLLKVGRPHPELEHAVSEANQREAARLYANVRWLCLVAGISPLLGLLGTVWGMINAFFITANLPDGVNKAQYLADGIYVALVTTLAGLTVAIPAAVLAHMFESRIQNLFREFDEILLGMLPHLERFESGSQASRSRHDRSASPVETAGEDRIEKLFRELDETLLGMLSQLERIEARLLANRRQHDPFALPVVRMVGNRWKAGA